MMASSSPRREILGLVVRAMLAHLRDTGLFEPVRAGVSAPTQLYMDKPPGLLAWASSTPWDEIYVIVNKLAGREALVGLGHAASRHATGSVVMPVVQMTLTLFGSTPDSLFANLDRFYAVATKGLSFTYENTGQRAGLVTARYQPPRSPPEGHHVTAGNLKVVFDLCAITSGTVEVVEALPGGVGARIRVAW